MGRHRKRARRRVGRFGRGTGAHDAEDVGEG
jgi:hypothetical protein